MSKKNKAPKHQKVKQIKEKRPAITLNFSHERGKGQNVDIVLSPVIKIVAALLSIVIFLFKLTGTLRRIKKFFKGFKRKKR